MRNSNVLRGNQPMNDDVIFIAHRGESYDAPENTLDAIILAWERNDDAAEIDIQLSKDGEIVVFHDINTKRITGINKKVCELTLEELRLLDVGSYKGEKWTNTRIPTFGEVLQTIPSGKKLFAEIKSDESILPFIAQNLKKYHHYSDNIILIDFNIQTAKKAKILFPDLTVLWIYDLTSPKFTMPDITHLIERTEENGLDGLDVSACDSISLEFSKILKEHNLQLYVWTVNDPMEAARLISTGVDGIASDRPHWLKNSLYPKWTI